MREITVPGCNARRKFLTLTVLCVMFAALGECSAQQVANAQPEKEGATSSVSSTGAFASQTVNVDQFLESLREIAEHGNLADTRYYGEKLGVTMRESASGRITMPRACPTISPVAHHYREVSGQIFYYSSVPDYFEKYGVHVGCEEPYQKEFLPNGLVRVEAGVKLDTKKICIYREDVHRHFNVDTVYVEKYMEPMSVIYGKNSVSVSVVFPQHNNDDCARSVIFKQNTEKGELK